MDLKRGRLPLPQHEQMEASTTIITTLPGSLLTNRNNTGGANKPQSNMTPPLMLLTSLSLQGRIRLHQTAALSARRGEAAEVISSSASTHLMVMKSLARQMCRRQHAFTHLPSPGDTLVSLSLVWVRRWAQFSPLGGRLCLLGIPDS